MLLNMVLININIVTTLIIIVLLSDKGLSTKRKRSPSSSSIPSTSSDIHHHALNTSEIPQEVTDIFAKRNKCKKDIFDVFEEDLSVHEHAIHAIEKLTLQGHRNFYADKYYHTLYKRMRPGRIVSVSVFCRPIAAIKYICKDEIRKVFKGYSTPIKVLGVAFYDLTTDEVYGKGSINAMNYFISIVNGFQLDIGRTPEFSEPFLKPAELCEQLIKMPKEFEEWDINLTL